MRRTMTAVLVGVALWVAAGCGEDPFKSQPRQVSPEAFGVSVDLNSPAAAPAPPGASTSPAPPPGPGAPPPPPPPPPPPAGEQQTAEPPAPAEAAPQEPAPPAEGMERQKAEMGVGKKGRGYEPGMITTPVATYFAARERMVFDIQIPQAMKMYKAVNEHGPKSHDEFMKKIIQENLIRLPDLPDGHRYLYDPTTEELMVERPKP